ncbi:GNAT family N-acetyltransferase [Blastococcus sp. SYSU D00820]
MDDLAGIRRAIDAVDEELVAVLARRERLVRAAGRLKTDAAAVRAPGRVEEVVARARATAERAGASPAVVERVYRAMVAAFVDLELAATGHADGVVVRRAADADAGEVLTLQRAAFVTEAQVYGDPHLPALTETLEELREVLARDVVLVAVRGARVVGAVRGRVTGDELAVGRLTVVPDCRGQGIGTALMRAVESAAGPGVRRAVLFTGARSEGNLRLYRGLGYVEQRRERVSAALEFVHLAKELGTPG